MQKTPVCCNGWPCAQRSSHGPCFANAKMLLQWQAWHVRCCPCRNQVIPEIGTVSLPLKSRQLVGKGPVICNPAERYVPTQAVSSVMSCENSTIPCRPQRSVRELMQQSYLTMHEVRRCRRSSYPVAAHAACCVHYAQHSSAGRASQHVLAQLVKF